MEEQNGRISQIINAFRMFQKKSFEFSWLIEIIDLSSLMEVLTYDVIHFLNLNAMREIDLLPINYEVSPSFAGNEHSIGLRECPQANNASPNKNNYCNEVQPTPGKENLLVNTESKLPELKEDLNFIPFRSEILKTILRRNQRVKIRKKIDSSSESTKKKIVIPSSFQKSLISLRPSFQSNMPNSREMLKNLQFLNDLNSRNSSSRSLQNHRVHENEVKSIDERLNVEYNESQSAYEDDTEQMESQFQGQRGFILSQILEEQTQRNSSLFKTTISIFQNSRILDRHYDQFSSSKNGSSISSDFYQQQPLKQQQQQQQQSSNCHKKRVRSPIFKRKNIRKDNY